MARHYSFDDKRVGKGDGEFFKVTGTKEHPQRIAYIPAEALNTQLVPTPQLKARADRGDAEAIQQLEDIMQLRETITTSLKKNPPSAQVWVNETGNRVILYAKTEGAKTFWIDNVGYVYWKEGIPPECMEKDPQIVYGFVLIEYELNQEGEIYILPPDRQIDLGGGNRLNFRYEMKPWSINDAKTRIWKEHSRVNPLIFTDYLVWTENVGKFPRLKLSPAGPAVWRQNPEVMKRVIREARKMYENLPKLIAKDFSVDEIIEMCPESRGGRSSGVAAAGQTMAEEVDFTQLLGDPNAAPPPAEGSVVQSQQAALPNQPSDMIDAFPSTMDASEMASLIGGDPGGSLPG